MSAVSGKPVSDVAMDEFTLIPVRYSRINVFNQEKLDWSPPLEVIADTHVHIYPVHDAAMLIAGARERLIRHASTPFAMTALFLTEGQSFDFFATLHANRDFETGPEREAMLFNRTGQSIWIIAGRQIVARERVEILSLACAEKISDGLPANEVIRRVCAAGGVPVLAWAPGKWMFKRAEVVRRLLDEFGPEELLLGDSSLRATGWPEPRLMKMRKTLAGSDPLPFAGEEEQAGRYGIRMQFDFDESRPVSSLRAALLNPQIPIERVGSRNTPWSMVDRMIKHRQQKRAAR